MKFISLLGFAFFIHTSCFCQAINGQVLTFISIQPTWVLNKASIIKAGYIRADSVFLYNKREHNKDSILVLSEYFDSLGNMVEKDEYTFDKKGVLRITSFYYVDNLLFKKEVMLQSGYKEKEITTYEYDSASNLITEKLYDYLKNGKITTTIWNRDYDDKGNVIKEYETSPYGNGISYLRQEYVYADGMLSEVKIYNADKKWMYSYLHQYDDDNRSESVFLSNEFNPRQLQHEFLYDDKKRIIEQKDYTEGHAYLDHITQTYSYNSAGLLERQTFKDIEGKTYYYKHFYTIIK